jgi:hypothetical protein
MAARCCNGQLWRGHRSRRFRPCLVGMASANRNEFDLALAIRAGAFFFWSAVTKNNDGRMAKGIPC